MGETIPEVFACTAQARAGAPALMTKRGGAWQTTTWRQYHERARQAARGFMALGLAPGEAVAIIGFTCEQWLVSDLATIMAGGTPAGIYTTSSPDLCAYVAGHCEARVVVVGEAEQLAKFKQVRDQLPALRAIVLMTGSDDDADVYGWNELLEMGAAADNESALDGRIADQKPENAAGLIYTSGTTGRPKAVLLSHRNLVWTAQTVTREAGLQPGDDQISYLPLSHIAEQMFSVYGPVTLGATVWFAESMDTLAETLAEVRPHFFFGVPRVWEKIQHKMEAAAADASPLQKRVAAWARGVGLRAAEAEEAGRARPLLYPLAKRLVFDKVQARLGLDRHRFLGTGAAPITRDTLDFFASLGMMIYEVWGQSESTGTGTFNMPGRVRRGSIGRVYPETEVRIADDGEILMRGPGVFLGYLHNQEATNDTLDADGWLYSGDVGYFDDDGFAYITDRKKELIITAGGENISPAHVEGEIKAIPVVSQCCVLGEQQRYLAALITLDAESLPDAAREADSPAATPAEAANCPKFNAWFQQQMDAVNARLARVQTIKRWTLLPEDFSIDGGELTPTMKLKRRVVHDQYQSQIDALYAD